MTVCEDEGLFTASQQRPALNEVTPEMQVVCKVYTLIQQHFCIRNRKSNVWKSELVWIKSIRFHLLSFSLLFSSSRFLQQLVNVKCWKLCTAFIIAFNFVRIISHSFYKIPIFVVTLKVHYNILFCAQLSRVSWGGAFSCFNGKKTEKKVHRF